MDGVSPAQPCVIGLVLLTGILLSGKGLWLLQWEAEFSPCDALHGCHKVLGDHSFVALVTSKL